MRVMQTTVRSPELVANVTFSSASGVFFGGPCRIVSHERATRPGASEDLG
jgi:hypothetical protein